MRFGIALLIATAGCIATLPHDPTVNADLACETARALVILRTTHGPGPAPKPKPGDRCPNCDGRGYVGDGTIKVSCEPCRGTGKVIGSVLVPQCKDGTCKTR